MTKPSSFSLILTHSLCILFMLFFSSCHIKQDIVNSNNKEELAEKIISDSSFIKVEDMARELVRGGFNAGDGYGEVWIRDYNTFIALACEVHEKEIIKNNLLTFFKFQGEEGDIVDGFIPIAKAAGGYNYRYSELAPQYAAHKNTVETDQESSLVQAIGKYVFTTGDQAFLQETVDDKTVLERSISSMDYLLTSRYDSTYGLLWGATTADWGDVQPEHEWGVELDENSHLSIDIYDNAMFMIAIDQLVKLMDDSVKADKWIKVHKAIKSNIREHLWDERKQKFIPHIYLNGSPFPSEFDEDKIHYHGGTAVAIEAGLLSNEEIETVTKQMIANVKISGAPSIGLTIYPPYPEGFFKNEGMYPYGYQNGGDWTWFGGRMIQQLIIHGFVAEAYQEVKPMINRVIKNDGFYEWYTVDGKPMGSGSFRGSAGILWEAIQLFRYWAENNKT